MTQVYVVSCGQYSDWTILGIFSSRELAEQFRDEGKASAKSSRSEPNDEIGEFSLDQGGWQPGVRPWFVKFGMLDGQVKEAEVGDFGDFAYPESPYRIQGPRDTQDLLCIYVPAKDRTQAIKAANERRLAWLALQNGDVE